MAKKSSKASKPATSVKKAEPTTKKTEKVVSTNKTVPATNNSADAQAKAMSFAQSTAGKLLIWALVFFFTYFLVDSLVQYLNNWQSAGIVNGKRIYYSKLEDNLVEQYGQKELEFLINSEVIAQEASKEGITITQEEIDARLEKIVEQFGGQEQFESALVSYSVTQDRVKEQIQNDLRLKKILEPEIEVNDEILQKFFDENKAVYFADNEVKFEDKKDEVRDIYIEQKVKEMSQTWLAEKTEDATITNNLEKEPKFKPFGTTIQIVKNLSK